MTPARKLYLDNIRWMTVVLVVIYHVVYMCNGVQPFGVIGVSHWFNAAALIRIICRRI